MQGSGRGLGDIWIVLDAAEGVRVCVKEGVGMEAEVDEDHGERMGIIRYIIIFLHIDYYLD
jgi:hypothetical protein